MEYPELKRAIEVIAKLRHPTEGCPWDLKQTHSTLLKYLIEESYEFVHATELDDSEKMCEEIGDVLLQVLLHSQIASETNKFDIEKVAKTLADKMIYRHPHVFKDPSKGRSEEEIVKNWKALKEAEQDDEYYMKEDYLLMPALMSADKIGKKSTDVNFDWENPQQVVEKVEEEWNEFKVEYHKKDRQKMQEELGDLFFSMAQLARHLDFDPEETLRKANQKFITRFNKVEDRAREQAIQLNQASSEQLEKLWNEVKKN
jgi:MazG family protein